MSEETQELERDDLIKWEMHPRELEVLWAPSAMEYTIRDTIKARAAKLKPNTENIQKKIDPRHTSEGRLLSRLGLPPRPVSLETTVKRVVYNAARNMLIDEGRTSLKGKEKLTVNMAEICRVTALTEQLHLTAMRCWFSNNPDATRYDGRWCRLKPLDVEGFIDKLEGFDLLVAGHAVRLLLVDPSKPATAENLKIGYTYGYPFGTMNKHGRKYFRAGLISEFSSGTALPKPGEDPQANQCTWTL